MILNYARSHGKITRSEAADLWNIFCCNNRTTRGNSNEKDTDKFLSGNRDVRAGSDAWSHRVDDETLGRRWRGKKARCSPLGRNLFMDGEKYLEGNSLHDCGQSLDIPYHSSDSALELDQMPRSGIEEYPDSRWNKGENV